MMKRYSAVSIGLRFTVAMLAFVLTSATWAGGIYLYEKSATDVALGSAGWTARADDASTIFSNPAGLTRLKGGNFDLTLMPLFVNAEFNPDPSLTTTNGADGNASGWLPAGGAFYSQQLSDTVTFGVGVGGYFGLAVEYEDTWVGRYYVKDAQLQALTIQPAVGIRLSKQWSIGVGVAAHYGIFSQTAAINNTPIFLPGPPQPDGELKIDTNDWTFQGNLGVLWEGDSQTRIGLQYLSSARLEFSDVPEFTGVRPALEAALRLGVRVYEQSRVEKFCRSGTGIEARTSAGRVRANKAVLATNAFRSPLRRIRKSTIAVWDYVLMSEPLSDAQLQSIGWQQRQGVGDSGNQFHYYRLTLDDRILWGGYDAIYHYGSGLRPEYEQRPESLERLSRQFFETFPQLEGLRFSHTWGGPIGTTTRFCMDTGSAFGGRIAWAIGYTGLGVVASRFGAQIALDRLEHPDSPRLKLRLARRRAFPWPPEPLRYLAIQLTQRELARADRNGGRRGVWLRLLDRLGLGFDS
jgi:hypothetical protein